MIYDEKITDVSWTEEDTKTDMTVDKFTCTADIVPTLLDLLGIKFYQNMRHYPEKTVQQVKERTIEMLELVGIANSQGVYNMYPHELSGGMKQRVGIARAFVNKPDIILMDEPFGALDAQTRNIMQAELIKLLDKTDQTIVFITHSVDEAVFLADRIVILSKRPAHINEVIEIPWERPRDRASMKFTALRKRILEELEKENVMDN